MKYKIGLGVVLIFAITQLFVAEKTPFIEPSENDFIAIEQPEEKVELMLKTICYDCHSNQIDYPWYTDIAVVSWWTQDHINEGREHLNFSEWGNYSGEKKEHKAEEAWEEIEEGEMPLESYTLIHRDADLSDEERELLVEYFKGIEGKY
ncbi:MAG: heme-binding domain-containing protein [Flavobacteriales bacterium]|nr:heme-binding domain-containing protein [Flavobacteriales bacterium]